MRKNQNSLSDLPRPSYNSAGGKYDHWHNHQRKFWWRSVTIFVSFAVSVRTFIPKQFSPSPLPLFTPSLTTATLLPKSQITRLQQIKNSLARAVVKALKSSHITPIRRLLHWLKITKRIEYKLLSLTYKVLTTTQPSYLHNLITVHWLQPPRSTRSSSLVTFASPSR